LSAEFSIILKFITHHLDRPFYIFCHLYNRSENHSVTVAARGQNGVIEASGTVQLQFIVPPSS